MAILGGLAARCATVFALAFGVWLAGTSFVTPAPPPPTVTGVAPDSGTILGGTSVTITGTNLTGATAVKFGNTNAKSFTVNSATKITAVSPAHSGGLVDITVTTPGGTNANTFADGFFYRTPGVSAGCDVVNGGFFNGSTTGPGSVTQTVISDFVAGDTITFNLTMVPPSVRWSLGSGFNDGNLDVQFSTTVRSYTVTGNLIGGQADTRLHTLAQVSSSGTASSRVTVAASCVPAAPTVGPEFRVNTRTAGSQQQPAVAGLVGDGFVVTWASGGQDGSGLGIYGQRYGKTGAKAGSEFRVNSARADNQSQPSVAGLEDGGFVVIWQSAGQDGSGLGIYGQRYRKTGAKAGGDFRVNTATAMGQSQPSVAGLDGGGFVVIWQSEDKNRSGFGLGLGIYGQRYDAAGHRKGSEFRVGSATPHDSSQPAVAALTGGGFVVTWQSKGKDGSGLGIYGQRYGKTGARAGGEFRINATAARDQSLPSAAGLSDGGFVVTWQSNRQDGSGLGIYGRRYTATGGSVGGEFRVNSITANNQGRPAVAAFVDGGFVVIWSSGGQDGSGAGVVGQAYNAAGARVYVEFGINTTATLTQWQPAAAALSGGNFVAVWTSKNQDGSLEGIYGQRFDLTGLPASADARAPASAR